MNQKLKLVLCLYEELCHLYTACMQKSKGHGTKEEGEMGRKKKRREGCSERDR